MNLILQSIRWRFFRILIVTLTHAASALITIAQALIKIATNINKINVIK